jgi:26S proteasome non-ATPase regulatory subunit 10
LGLRNNIVAISEGHGDAALLLLKEGAESNKKDIEGRLAIDTAPDSKVRLDADFL